MPSAIATSNAPLATAYAALRSASDAVAQKFSTCVTGLSWSCNGRASIIPLIPDIAVPSQYASMSSLLTPADANASADDSSMRSSALLLQCSPNGVHPIPTMATRSLMPFELMCALFSLRPNRAGLPEVVVDLVRREQAAERHLDAVAHLQVRGVDIAELDRQPA